MIHDSRLVQTLISKSVSFHKLRLLISRNEKMYNFIHFALAIARKKIT